MRLFKRNRVLRSASVVLPSGGTLPIKTAAADSGMLTSYRPSQHIKPEQRGVIGRIQKWFLRAFRRTDPSLTTEQGASSAASPSTYEYSLIDLRYARRQVIDDCVLMFKSEARCRRAVLMYALEAVRKGCTIVVNTKGRGTTGRNARIAKEVAERVQKLVNPVVSSWAAMEVVEGEVFIQVVVLGNEIVKVKRMPTSSMERNTDDADEFVDPQHAFSQVDVVTNEEVATFPLALMHHERWQWVDGERYGTPSIIASRRMARLIELAEESQLRRRMIRATMRLYHQIGDKDNPGTWDQVEDYKAKNGFVEGQLSQLNPVEVGRDFFNNGPGAVTPIEGDQNIDKIDDLHYDNDVYAVGLPTPKALYGMAGESINRDVLKDQRSEWLKQTVTLSDSQVNIIRFIVDLGLLLKGILPETVDYDVHFSESSIESPSEIIARVIQARNNTLGTGKSAQPDPLISKRRAVQMVAEFYDIDDVDAELAEIDREMAELDAKVSAMMEAEQGMSVAGGEDEPSGDRVRTQGKETTRTIKPLTSAPSAGGKNGNGNGSRNGNGRELVIQGGPKRGDLYGQPDDPTHKL